MKKVLSILLLFTSLNLYSEEITPTPYNKDEFNPILLDIRRASIIFCGAFPLGYMYSSIIGDPIFDQNNMFVELDETEKNNKEIEIKLISSLIFAGSVMIIDFIIEKFIRR